MTKEVDIGEAFGKRVVAITWAGDNMCVLKLEGDIKLLFYAKDGKMVMESIVGDLTNLE